jgi:hypothetical protein
MGSFGISLLASNSGVRGGHAGFLSASAIARVIEAGGTRWGDEVGKKWNIAVRSLSPRADPARPMPPRLAATHDGDCGEEKAKCSSGRDSRTTNPGEALQGSFSIARA